MQGQSFLPLFHWTFDAANPLSDKVKGQVWSKQEDSKLKKEQGVLGNYLSYTPDKKVSHSIPINIKNDFSIEFWLKFDQENFKETQALFYYNDQKINLILSYPELRFITHTKTANGTVVRHSLPLKLDGAGKESLGYFLDDAWHHFVFQAQVSKGIKEIWIDGELLPKLSIKDAPKGSICGPVNCDEKFLNFNLFNDFNMNFIGGLDEVAIYNKILPAALVKQHYQEVKNGKHYSFRIEAKQKARVLESAPVQAEVNVVEGIDSREFALGHPRVRRTAVQQLRNYPLPRYKKGHKLNRLFSWMAMDFFGGKGQKGVSYESLDRNISQIQEELSLNWHYYLTLTASQSAKKDANGNLNPRTQVLINLANKYPHIPLALITLWPQVSPSVINLDERLPRISQANEDYAIRNVNKQKLDRKGNPGYNRVLLSPRIPEERFKSDGKIQAALIQNLLEELKRPINIINENGEVPFLPYPKSLLEKDPDIVRHKNQLKIKDWDTYQALQKNRLKKAYSQEFLKMPALKKAQFTWYGVDAGPQDRFEWKTARLISSKINGQYYSTPDLYVRWPDNWNGIRGAWRGFPWIEKSRKIEIATGDKLFSPFVAAGWNKDPELNVRPSQWLGLLKCMGPIGAEFFYTGFFNLQAPFAKPENYAWQAVMPAYAQAITSQYEGLLKQGNVPFDEQGSPIVRLKTSDPRILATVRKLNKQYILALSLQPLSNTKGNTSEEISVKVTIDQVDISCMARRQGSVYFIDLTNKTTPVFYQLDSWHETGHPSYWSQNFAFEAEVFDYSMGQQIVTERKNNPSTGDFRKYTSYLKATDEKACSKYHFQPRKNNASYQLRVRARCNSGNRGNISIILDGKELGDINNIKSGEWRWYTFPTKIKNLEAKDHMLSLLQSDMRVELDKFVLEAK